jgi:hypothetical protein
MRNLGNQVNPYHPKWDDLKVAELFMFNYVRDQVYIQVWRQVNDQVSNQMKRNLKYKV